MSTKDFVTQNEKGEITEFQALAVTLANAKQVSELSPQELYESASDQMTVVATDMEMPPVSDIELNEPKILSNITGQDSRISEWAVRVVPTREECSDYAAAEEREELLRIVREATRDLMHTDLCKVNAFFSHHPGFMGNIELVTPQVDAKLALDFAYDFYPRTAQNQKLYKKSKEIAEPSVRLVVFPGWVNEEWLYWKAGTAGFDNYEQLEPPRIMMIYDVESNTAFLLGARCFVEIKKAAIAIIGNMAVRQKLGLPLNGAAQSFTVAQGSKSVTTTFAMVGVSGTGKSTLLTASHDSHLKQSKQEVVVRGADDSLIMMVNNINGRKTGLLSLERAYFHKTDNIKSSTPVEQKIVSAENVMVADNEEGKKVLVYNNALDNEGRVLVLPDTEDAMVPHLNLPDYFVLLTHDHLLPPVMLVKDTSLMRALFLSYGSEEGDAYLFEPAANPHTLWPIEKDLALFEKAYAKAKFKMLILNTDSFYRTERNTADISKEVTAGILLRIAKGEVQWKEWTTTMPGFFLPSKNSLKSVRKDYETLYDPEKIKDQESYRNRLRLRVEERVEFLKQLNLSASFLVPFYKILSRLS